MATDDLSRPDRLGERRDRILDSLVAFEAPRVMAAFAALIVAFDLMSLLAGETASPEYYASDALQVAGWLIGAYVIRRGALGDPAAPWVFAAATTLSAVVVSYQYWLYPTSSAIGVVVLMLTAFGALVLRRRVFTVTAVAVAVAAASAITAADPPGVAGWYILIGTAVAVSATLMWTRRRTALQLAGTQLELEEMALHDQLTGLLNRHGMAVATAPLLAAARRQGEPVSVAFVDIVGLKAINDRHGHVVGDQVIQRCASAVRAAGRASDVIGRWGGDEFVVVGRGDNLSAEAVAQRIRAQVDVSGIEQAWDGTVWVGTATGTAEDPAALIDRADHDMYSRRPRHD